MSPIFNNYVDKCQSFWANHHSIFKNVTNPPRVNPNDPYPGFEVAVFNDPGYGRTYGQNVYEKKNGLLIVGCNPSGIAKHHVYRKAIPNPQSPDYRNFFIVNTYPLVNDPYTKAIHEFAVDCGYGENYYKMDIFGIMRLKQSVLSDDIKKKRCKHVDQYKELFRIFVETVIELKPEKIVFANAFISNLIQGKDYVYARIRDEYIEVGDERDNKGGLTLTFKGDNGTCNPKVWFSSMLSGQRALDNGSKELLIWAVRRPEDAN